MRIGIIINKWMKLKNLFPGVKEYWESRYSTGGIAGNGSYGRLAEFKAEIINTFVRENGIRSVIDFGCGDGAQLSLFKIPYYIGLDISPTAIKLCKKRFTLGNDKSKSFFLYDPDCFLDNHRIFNADLGLSLDVIYHLVEDKMFNLYMEHLFSASNRYVIIYSSNIDTKQVFHERHREFTKWIEENIKGWELIQKIENRYPNRTLTKDYPKSFVYKPGTSVSDFYIYKKLGVP